MSSSYCPGKRDQPFSSNCLPNTSQSQNLPEKYASCPRNNDDSIPGGLTEMYNQPSFSNTLQHHNREEHLVRPQHNSGDSSMTGDSPEKQYIKQVEDWLMDLHTTTGPPDYPSLPSPNQSYIHPHQNIGNNPIITDLMRYWWGVYQLSYDLNLPKPPSLPSSVPIPRSNLPSPNKRCRAKRKSSANGRNEAAIGGKRSKQNRRSKGSHLTPSSNAPRGQNDLPLENPQPLIGLAGVAEEEGIAQEVEQQASRKIGEIKAIDEAVEVQQPMNDGGSNIALEN